jgi:formate dehydrogenase subunit delta
MDTAMEPRYVRLANDVAVQFAHRPLDDAAEAVAEHLRAFWEPRMRAALLAHVAAGGTGLDPVARLAAALLQNDMVANRTAPDGPPANGTAGNDSAPGGQPRNGAAPHGPPVRAAAPDGLPPDGPARQFGNPAVTTGARPWGG